MYLGRAAQVDAAVALVVDFPVDPHLEVAVIFRAAEIAAVAVVDENAIHGFPSRNAKLGDSVVRGRLPGSRLFGRSGFSQNICPRVPMQKPSSGITGDDCSQPPEGVALTILPSRSITSRWQVSAPITPSRATVGSPAPGARVSRF